jgi:hypothetical protein
MDYLLSREKTSSLRSNPGRARSILVNRDSVLTIYIPQLYGKLFGVIRKYEARYQQLNLAWLTFDLHYPVFNKK